MEKIQAFVINLNKSIQRWSFITYQFQKYSQSISLERFPAIYGPSLKRPELSELVHPLVLEKLGQRDDAEIPHIAAIGCYLSHYNIWKMIASSVTIPFALVMEDDVELLDNRFDQNLRDTINRAPEKWEVLFIEDIKHLSPPKSVHGPAGKYFQIPTYHICAAGYLLSKAGAEKLVKNALPIRYQVDNFMAKSKLNKYCLIKPLLTQNHGFEQENNDKLRLKRLSDSSNQNTIGIIVAAVGFFLFIIFLITGLILWDNNKRQSPLQRARSLEP